MKKNLILVGGKAGSGKDFIGKIFMLNGYKRLAFADYLKDIVADLYKLNREDLNTQEGKSKVYKEGMTYRDLLIKAGYFHKYKDINVFTDIIIGKMKGDNISNYVITDFRFPHEYDRIKSELSGLYNIYTINISRASSLNVDDPSERALDNFNFHYRISNDYTKEYLEDKLKLLGFF